jgi:hypothetical protein
MARRASALVIVSEPLSNAKVANDGATRLSMVSPGSVPTSYVTVNGAVPLSAGVRLTSSPVRGTLPEVQFAPVSQSPDWSIFQKIEGGIYKLHATRTFNNAPRAKPCGAQPMATPPRSTHRAGRDCALLAHPSPNVQIDEKFISFVMAAACGGQALLSSLPVSAQDVVRAETRPPLSSPAGSRTVPSARHGRVRCDRFAPA